MLSEGTRLPKGKKKIVSNAAERGQGRREAFRGKRVKTKKGVPGTGSVD